jgi:nucleotide-binding universal stress UspA family protein
MNKLLVPIDFSDYSKNALEYAAVLAKKLNASITVFHCYYIATPPEYGTLSTYMNMAIEEEQKRSEEQMAEFVKDYQQYAGESDQKLQINTKVKMGLPTEDIIDMVKEHQFDMVIMGTKGATGLDRILFGSVTGNVIEDDSIKCPVLAVPKGTNYRSISHILYGMDYEEDDVPVIDSLLEFAGEFDAKLTCLHISTDEDLEASDRLEKEILEDTYWFTPYSKIKFELVKNESVKKGMETYLKENKVDLIAVQPRERNFLENLFHKSVSANLYTYAGVPVLVLKK